MIASHYKCVCPGGPHKPQRSPGTYSHMYFHIVPCLLYYGNKILLQIIVYINFMCQLSYLYDIFKITYSRNPVCLTLLLYRVKHKNLIGRA